MFKISGLAMVVGSNGLLGKIVSNTIWGLGACVARMDINGVRTVDNIIDVTDSKQVVDSLSIYEPNFFINCSYPRDPADHYKAFVNSTEIIAEWMAKRGGGSIINLASIYGVVGPCDDIYDGTSVSMPSSYAAVKGAIITHSRCMATRYGKNNVLVNIVSPGGVYNGQPDSFVENYCQRVPLRRMATPEDIAGVVAFLCTPAAKYITGQNIIVDGGLTAW